MEYDPVGDIAETGAVIQALEKYKGTMSIKTIELVVTAKFK